MLVRRWSVMGLGHLALLLGVFILLLSFNFSSRQLLTNDDTRFPVMARDVLTNGHWLVPALQDGRPHLAKPLLVVWLMTLASWPAGAVSAKTAILRSLLEALGVVLVTCWIGRRLFDAAAGMVAGLIAVTTVGVFRRFRDLAHQLLCSRRAHHARGGDHAALVYPAAVRDLGGDPRGGCREGPARPTGAPVARHGLRDPRRLGPTAGALLSAALDHGRRDRCCRRHHSYSTLQCAHRPRRRPCCTGKPARADLRDRCPRACRDVQSRSSGAGQQTLSVLTKPRAEPVKLRGAHAVLELSTSTPERRRRKRDGVPSHPDQSARRAGADVHVVLWFARLVRQVEDCVVFPTATRHRMSDGGRLCSCLRSTSRASVDALGVRTQHRSLSGFVERCSRPHVVPRRISVPCASLETRLSSRSASNYGPPKRGRPAPSP